VLLLFLSCHCPFVKHIAHATLAAVLADLPVCEPQIASIGCNIKWHPGAAPAWAR